MTVSSSGGGVSLGGTGTGFQLFTQTADNQSAIYTGVDQAAAEAARDAYFGSNPSDLTTLDNNEFLIIKLIVTGTTPDTISYQQRQNNDWVDVTSLVQGENGAATTNLQAGTVAVSDGNEFTSQGVNVDQSSGETTFDETINVPSGSINIGEVIQLTEGVSNLILVNEVDSVNNYIPHAAFDSTGTANPTYLNLGAQFTLNLQLDDSQTLTANPLNFSVTGTVVSPDERQFNQITFRTGGVMTNFRARVTDNASGKVVRYIPSKAVFDAGTGGFTLVSGDNIFDFISTAPDSAGVFNLGVSPFLVKQGQQLDFTIEADAVDILGDLSGIPFITSLAQDGPEDPLLVGPEGVTDSSVVLFDGTSGGVLKEASTLTFETSGNVRSLEFNHDVVGAGTEEIQFFDSTSTLVTRFSHNFATNETVLISSDALRLESTSGALSLVTLGGDININANTGINDNVSIRADLDINLLPGQLVDITSTTNEGVRSLIIERSGTQSARIDMFVNGRSPILGNILGAEGSIVFEESTTTSNIWIHKGTSATTTDWFPFITGPNTATVADRLMIWNSTTGDIASDPSIITYTTSGDDRRLDFTHDVSSSGDVVLRWFTDTPQQVARIFYDFSNDEFNINADIGPLQLLGQGGMLFTQTTSFGSFQFDSTGAEGSHLIVLNRTGAQAGEANITISNRTPIGNVSGFPGSYHYRVSGTTSDLYFHRGASLNNSDWFPSITGPNTATVNNTLMVFNGTAGSAAQEASPLVFNDAGVNNFLDMQHDSAVDGSAGFRILDSVSTVQTTFAYNEVSNELNFTAAVPFTFGAGGAFTVDTTSGNGQIRLLASNNTVLIDNGTATETTALMTWDRGFGPTNGAAIDVYASVATPVGTVTGNPGDWAVLESGASSDLFIHRGASADNTSWVGVFASIAAQDTLAEVLSNGNTTGGTDIDITAGDTITASGGTNQVIDIDSSSTNANVVQVTANSLSQGSGLRVESSSNDGFARNIVEFAQTAASPSGVVLDVNQGGSDKALNIVTSSTDIQAIDIRADSLTTGEVLNAQSNSSSTATRYLFVAWNSSPAATGARCLRLIQDSTNSALQIEADTTAANIINVPTADSLTTGAIASFISNSADTSVRNLVEIINDNASANNAECLFLRNDADENALVVLSLGGAVDFSSTTTTATCAVFDADSLITGMIADFASSSTDASARDLVKVRNTGAAATGAIPLGIENASTGPLIELDRSGATVELFADNATAVGNITGDPGDVNFLESGVDSDIQVHIGSSANNTDWAGCVGGPAVIGFGANGVAVTTTTRYLFPWFDDVAAQITPPFGMRVPRDGFLRNMYLIHNVVGVSANAIVYTVRVNSVASALTISVAATATGGEDTTNVVAVSAGDTIDVEVTKALAITTSPMDIIVNFELV